MLGGFFCAQFLNLNAIQKNVSTNYALRVDMHYALCIIDPKPTPGTKRGYVSAFTQGQAMTPSELHNHFMLNTTTGRLFQPCGSLRKGYRRVHVADRTFAEHRVVFAMVHGRWPDGMIDHINGDRTDNRPCNLREATHAQNAQNSKANKNNSTGYRGVHWHKGERKYRARINANGVAHNLGSFAHPGIAALIYVTASTRLHGNFASLTHQVAA